MHKGSTVNSWEPLSRFRNGLFTISIHHILLILLCYFLDTVHDYSLFTFGHKLLTQSSTDFRKTFFALLIRLRTSIYLLPLLDGQVMIAFWLCLAVIILCLPLVLPNFAMAQSFVKHWLEFVLVNFLQLLSCCVLDDLSHPMFVTPQSSHKLLLSWILLAEHL